MFEDNVKRQHFLTVQDCRNIAQKIHHKCIVRHENDAQSVALVVGELQTEENNSVLFYKPQNTEDKSGKHLPRESFLLVLQTKFQKELYTSFASKVVCIDSTHKTNSYDFKLISLLVPDEYGEGKIM